MFQFIVSFTFPTNLDKAAGADISLTFYKVKSYIDIVQHVKNLKLFFFKQEPVKNS